MLIHQFKWALCQSIKQNNAIKVRTRISIGYYSIYANIASCTKSIKLMGFWMQCLDIFSNWPKLRAMIVGGIFLFECKLSCIAITILLLHVQNHLYPNEGVRESNVSCCYCINGCCWIGISFRSCMRECQLYVGSNTMPQDGMPLGRNDAIYSMT